MKTTSRFLSIAVASVLACTATDATAGGVWVLNNNDHGAGSFREAVGLANADASVTWIKFSRGLGPLELESTVQFTGAQALSIEGQGATITAKTGSAPFDLFVASGGGRLDASGLAFAGSGGNGLVVAVPETATEDVHVALSQITLADNLGNGLLIDDMLGSLAGIALSLQRCTVTGNGNAASDIDAVRVNERGVGGITADIKECLFQENGNDAVELDEAGPGDISVQVLHSGFMDNGFKDPGDMEDGIDADEADEGDVIASVVDCEFIGNGDEATDFNEAGPGSLYASFNQVTANGNKDKGLTAEESGEGGLYAMLNQITANKNKKEGVKFDETDAGDMEVELNNAHLEANGDDGMQAEETAAGNLLVRVVNSTIIGSKKFGVNAPQGGEGEGCLRLQHVTLLDNESGPYKAKGTEVVEVGVPREK